MTRGFQLDDLFRLKFISQPQISPEGRDVVFVVTVPDREEDTYRTNIWLARGEEAATALTFGKKDSSPKFSPDGALLAFVRPDEGDKPQIWIMSMAGGEARAVTSTKEGVSEFALSPDGGLLAFTATTLLDPEREEKDPIAITRGAYKSDGAGLLKGKRRHLFVCDLDGGEAKQLTEGDFSVASPTWSPDGKQIVFVTAIHLDRDIDFVSHLFEIDSSGGSPRQLTDWKGSAFTPVWSPDAKALVFAGRDPAGSNRHSRLYKLDAGGGVPIEIAPDFDRNVMVGAPGYPGAPPTITKDGKTIIFCARERGCTHAYSVPFEGGMPKEIVGGADRVIAGLSLAKEAQNIALLISAPETPGDLYLAEADGTDETRLTQMNDKVLSEIEIPLPERRSFVAPDGKEIEGWVVLGSDKGSNTDPRPLLLDIHGGPHNAFGPIFSAGYLYRLVLASQGWNILFINPRGSDGYGEDFFTALTGGWGEYDMDDFMSAVDALIEEGIADPDRLSVTGYSYGGFMTNWLVSHTDRFAAAVTGGCVTNLTSQYGSSDYGTFLSWEIGGEAYENAERYFELSPLTYVDKVTTPVLILHGQSDDRCPVSEAEQWFRALRQQRKTVEMVLYPGSSHLFILQGPPSHRLDYSQRLVEWVTKHASGKSVKEAK